MPEPKKQSYTEKILADYPFEMIYIQGGSFMMGGKKYSNEKPIHPIELSDFYLARYPVTQGLWKAVMGKNPAYFRGDALPVERVSWRDAQEFIQKLNADLRAQGKAYEYALPTEAQWEYAARGGLHQDDHTLEYAGSDELSEMAWYENNNDLTTMPPGLKAPNALGLYDMSGNVFEWCADWYGSYESSPAKDPPGPADGSYRVYRGGSWYDYSEYCRVAFRFSIPPEGRYDPLGLRLSCNPQAPAWE